MTVPPRVPSFYDPISAPDLELIDRIGDEVFGIKREEAPPGGRYAIRSGRFWEVRLTDVEVERAKFHAEECSIAGASNIREREDRLGNLSIDNLVGMMGECAFHLLLWPEDGLALWDGQRAERNKDRYRGDGGEDVKGQRIDIKTSAWRHDQLSLLKHNLYVRGGERHPGFRYVQAFASLKKLGVVWFVGWANEADLPPVQEGDAKDTRYQRLVDDLRRLPVPLLA